MNYIERNLYAFYNSFGSSDSVGHIVEKDFEVIMAENGDWPQMIYNIHHSVPPEESVSKIVSGISERKYPPFFIVPESYISRAHTGILKKYGVVPVKLLYGMNYIIHSRNESFPMEKIVVSQLNEDDELNQYSELINSELLSGELPFNPALLKVSGNDKIKLFGIKKNQTLISALFLLEMENKVGLYFIATRKDFQKKGYATFLIQTVINYLYNIHINELILHANHEAFGLYKKMGFINQSRFIIYRKL